MFATFFGRSRSQPATPSAPTAWVIRVNDAPTRAKPILSSTSRSKTPRASTKKSVQLRSEVNRAKAIALRSRHRRSRPLPPPAAWVVHLPNMPKTAKKPLLTSLRHPPRSSFARARAACPVTSACTKLEKAKHFNRRVDIARRKLKQDMEDRMHLLRFELDARASLAEELRAMHIQRTVERAAKVSRKAQDTRMRSKFRTAMATIAKEEGVPAPAPTRTRPTPAKLVPAKATPVAPSHAKSTPAKCAPARVPAKGQTRRLSCTMASCAAQSPASAPVARAVASAAASAAVAAAVTSATTAAVTASAVKASTDAVKLSIALPRTGAVQSSLASDRFFLNLGATTAQRLAVRTGGFAPEQPPAECPPASAPAPAPPPPPPSPVALADRAACRSIRRGWRPTGLRIDLAKVDMAHWDTRSVRYGAGAVSTTPSSALSAAPTEGGSAAERLLPVHALDVPARQHQLHTGIQAAVVSASKKAQTFGACIEEDIRVVDLANREDASVQTPRHASPRRQPHVVRHRGVQAAGAEARVLPAAIRPARKHMPRELRRRLAGRGKAARALEKALHDAQMRRAAETAKRLSFCRVVAIRAVAARVRRAHTAATVAERSARTQLIAATLRAAHLELVRAKAAHASTKALRGVLVAEADQRRAALAAHERSTARCAAAAHRRAAILARVQLAARITVDTARYGAEKAELTQRLAAEHRACKAAAKGAEVAARRAIHIAATRAKAMDGSRVAAAELKARAKREIVRAAAQEELHKAVAAAVAARDVASTAIDEAVQRTVEEVAMGAVLIKPSEVAAARAEEDAADAAEWTLVDESGAAAIDDFVEVKDE